MSVELSQMFQQRRECILSFGPSGWPENWALTATARLPRGERGTGPVPEGRGSAAGVRRAIRQDGVTGAEGMLMRSSSRGHWSHRVQRAYTARLGITHHLHIYLDSSASPQSIAILT